MRARARLGAIGRAGCNGAEMLAGIEGTTVVAGEALKGEAEGEADGAGSVAVTGGAVCRAAGVGVVAAGAGMPCCGGCVGADWLVCVEDAGVTVRGRVPVEDEEGAGVCVVSDACPCAGTTAATANTYTTNARGNKNPFFIFNSEFSVWSLRMFGSLQGSLTEIRARALRLSTIFHGRHARQINLPTLNEIKTPAL